MRSRYVISTVWNLFCSGVCECEAFYLITYAVCRFIVHSCTLSSSSASILTLALPRLCIILFLYTACLAVHVVYHHISLDSGKQLGPQKRRGGDIKNELSLGRRGATG